MGFWDIVNQVAGAVISNGGETGRGSLKQAADPSLTKNKSGVYILRVSGRVMKVGSAEIGIQKRMQQYYELNTSCGLNRYISRQNRDDINVSWQYCESSDCKELESKLFDKYGGIGNMPWAVRRPYSTKDTLALKI